MNIFQKIIWFIPTMTTFLKGHQLFIRRDFAKANQLFNKCLNHPKFHNDLLFSLYGQSLCATGRLEEGHSFLLKACEFYETDSWIFDNKTSLDTAKNCIEALKHTCHHLDLEEGRQYFNKQPKIKDK